MKPGPKPKGKVKIEWSPDFAYAIGLLASDGCLLKSGSHIDLTSKDTEQLLNFKKCLGLDVKIGQKSSYHKGKRSIVYRVQFKDALFYRFLLTIGLHPAKSHTIGSVSVPPEFVFDYLRGELDGDGCFYSYWDKRWKSSFMYYLVFNSASIFHIKWLRREIENSLGVKGHINFAGKNKVHQLKYAKRESMKILERVYYSPDVRCLSRKRLKIERALSIVGERLP